MDRLAEQVEDVISHYSLAPCLGKISLMVLD